MQVKPLNKNKNTYKRQLPDTSRISPPSCNGYELSTEQLHRLLSSDQINTCESSFDKAVQKQKQLFSICNTLDRQNQIHQEIQLLLNKADGIHWLDFQISEFKSLCPTEILEQLSRPSKETIQIINNSQIINQEFFNLFDEQLYSPLKTLAKISPENMNEFDRGKWHHWCQNIDSRLGAIKNQIKSAQEFFSLKTFDKIEKLAKDNITLIQLGNIKHLFQQNTFPTHDVEHYD